MKRNRLAYAALTSLLLCIAPTFVQDAAPAKVRTATVIFLRHAEALPRTAEEKNPELAEAGKLRAERIARTLRAAGVTRVFATELKRTQATAGAIAALFELKIEAYDAGKSKQFAEQLAALKDGEVAVVVGHSNTVPAMVKALGGALQGLDERGYLNEDEYDRMIVQVLQAMAKGEAMRAVQTLDLRIEM